MDEELHEAGRRAQDRRDRESGGGAAHGAEDGDGTGAAGGGGAREEAEPEDAGAPPADRREGGRPDGTHGEAGGGTHRVEDTAKTSPRRRHGYNEDDDLVTKQVCEMAETEEDPEVRASLKKRCIELRQE